MSPTAAAATAEMSSTGRRPTRSASAAEIGVASAMKRIATNIFFEQARESESRRSIYVTSEANRHIWRKLRSASARKNSKRCAPPPRGRRSTAELVRDAIRTVVLKPSGSGSLRFGTVNPSGRQASTTASTTALMRQGEGVFIDTGASSQETG